MGTMKVVIIKPRITETVIGIPLRFKNKVEVKEIGNKIEDFYAEICADCIDIQERTIDGKTYDIICDDEAFLKGNCVKTVQSKRGDDWSIVNAVIICRQCQGEEIGLTDIEVARIMENLDPDTQNLIVD